MTTKLKIFMMLIMLVTLPTVLVAQKDVTQFLGIPVDGSKNEMIDKLKSKGFTIGTENKDVLVGQFNGSNVLVNVVTNNNKVCRIMVTDVVNMNAGDIKIRFNTLCRQFQDNKKYIAASLSSPNYILSENEDISYEISIHKKRYEATFFQLPSNSDSTTVSKEIQSFVFSKYTKEQLSNPTEELKNEMVTKTASYLYEKYSKKAVWFMINEYHGKYYISMYYDNEYNRANGEDL